MAIKSSSLIEAVKNCSIQELQCLLDKEKEDINVGDEFKRTPLHFAVLGSFEQGVTLLLERGAQVNACDAIQQTPFHWSCLVKSQNMINALLDKGAEINRSDIDGNSPISMAVNINFKEGVELLLAKGADVNTQDMEGDTPLHCATKQGNLPMVEMLLNNGANLKLKNNNGETALHVAAWTCKRTLIRLLLLYGAEVNAQDHNGSTLLHLILERLPFSESGVVEDLLDWGASLTITNKAGKTPLTLASDPSDRFKDWSKYVLSFFRALTIDTKVTFHVHILIRHFIKLQCVNLRLAYKSSYMTIYSQGGYKTLCDKELAKLKTTRFGNQSVLNVFSTYEDPTFLSNVEMREAIYSSEFETEFPLYNMLMRAMFRHAEKRVHLFNAAQGVLIHVMKAPYEISRKIFCYLSNEDLVNIVTAGNCV
ncbi:hypothetical protein J6590_053272 [Homalodisca vitripennis]|nr:hypothetical protein J6590_097388 [Homalodisca vitripennis]KAG8336048.1 hypothetical protein J6590_053271 [Homalodisca vitripennis]KAG8336049.1 hypothetical protein J6590_053272 [Homalodisca vitripennis]